MGVCNAGVGDAPKPSPPASNVDTIVVTGERLGELRQKIEIAAQVVLDRFNEINGNDKFDIHCRDVASLGTRIRHRECDSNSWREEDAGYGESRARAMQLGDGSYSAPVDANDYLFRALYMQHRLTLKAEQLAATDENFGAALKRLGEAQEEYAEAVGDDPKKGLTRSFQMTPSSEGLPFGAKRMDEVLFGHDNWKHALTQRTFTLSQVVGEIRKMQLECDHGGQRLSYADGVDWTVPADWGNCLLIVGAKPDTTFALYEFE